MRQRRACHLDLALAPGLDRADCGTEIAFDVADSPQSAVLQQVSNGVHVRMAVLFHLLVGTDEAVTV